MELTDSMIIQMLGEADAAERRAGQDALSIGCSPQQVHDIELGVRCETIRSYLYQAGILVVPPERESHAECERFSPPEWTEHWRESHRGHGCNLDPDVPNDRRKA